MKKLQDQGRGPLIYQVQEKSILFRKQVDKRRTLGSDAEDAMKRYHWVRDTRWPQTKLGECLPFVMNVMASHTFAFHVSMKNMIHMMCEIHGDKSNIRIYLFQVIKQWSGTYSFLLWRHSLSIIFTLFAKWYLLYISVKCTVMNQTFGIILHSKEWVVIKSINFFYVIKGEFFFNYEFNEIWFFLCYLK